MAETTTKRGARGEQIAEAYLQAQGYETLAKNFRMRRAEIDLIMRSPDCVVFVEVKWRSKSSFGEAESFVSAQKEERILEAADEFLQHYPPVKQIRFDIVAISGQEPNLQIEHFKDAFG